MLQGQDFQDDREARNIRGKSIPDSFSIARAKPVLGPFVVFRQTLTVRKMSAISVSSGEPFLLLILFYLI
jgi:hypothetical protein